VRRGRVTPLAPDDPRHGIASSYTNHNCRCDACREAQTAYMRERQIGPYRKTPCPNCGEPKHYESELCQTCRYAALEPPHGTESRYMRCGCGECREAANAARQRRRLRAALADP
jgi:hypothetical protein